jgi:maleate isomerase
MTAEKRSGHAANHPSAGDDADRRCPFFGAMRRIDRGEAVVLAECAEQTEEERAGDQQRKARGNKRQRAHGDAHPDLIVFHCTHTSMKEGADGEARIISLIRKTTGIEALSTSSLVSDALRALGLKKLVVLSPYQSNADIIAYLGAAGFTVIKDVALKCNTAADFEAITPQRWLELARENDTPEADGVFLSCTNTTQIEAIEAIERELGKPVVNSNQAVLWGCLKRLKNRLGEPFTPPSDRGSLMNDLEG